MYAAVLTTDADVPLWYDDNSGRQNSDDEAAIDCSLLVEDPMNRRSDDEGTLDRIICYLHTLYFLLQTIFVLLTLLNYYSVVIMKTVWEGD